MGFESFNLVLLPKHSGSSFSVAQVEEYILGYSTFIKKDGYYGLQSESPAFVYKDDESLFEIQAYHDSPRISIRYALCNPVSIDYKVSLFAYYLAEKFGFELSLYGQENIEVFDFGNSTPDFDQVSGSICTAAHRSRQVWCHITGITSEIASRPGEALDMLKRNF